MVMTASVNPVRCVCNYEYESMRSSTKAMNVLLILYGKIYWVDIFVPDL